MDLIDLEPLRPGWGRIWQGGIEEIANRLSVPQPWAVFSMIGGYEGTVRPTVSVYIEDDPAACLSDADLLSLVSCAIVWLKSGTNLIIHCLQGKSRSSYLDIAIHMAVFRSGYDQAFGYVRRQHPICQPNIGFEAHLRRMEEKLKEVTF